MACICADERPELFVGTVGVVEVAVVASVGTGVGVGIASGGV